MADERALIPGSHQDLPSGATQGEPTSGDEHLQLTVVLRGKTGAPGRGVDLEDLRAVLGWAAQSGLELEDVLPLARTIGFSAPAARCAAIFDVELVQFEWQGASYRGHTGGISVPRELSQIVTGLFGLDTRPVGWHTPVTSVAEAETLSPLQLKAAYHLPAGGDGAGECVGVIQLGGAHEHHDVILEAMRFGLPAPEALLVPVGRDRVSEERHVQDAGATTVARAEDVAVALDMQVISTIAPGVRLVTYSAANTSQGLIDAAATAISDNERRPSALLVNWSSGEGDGLVTPSLMRAVDCLFEVAVGHGVTVLVGTQLPAIAAVPERKARVAFPASSRNVVACAGAALTMSGASIETEAPWASPGARAAIGVSKEFEPPSWQKELPDLARRRGRVTPDVAAHAAGYLITVGGVPITVGGGGASASVWAATVALANQAIGRRLGAHARVLAQRWPTDGSPDGWDPKLGFGSPDGHRIGLVADVGA